MLTSVTFLPLHLPPIMANPISSEKGQRLKEEVIQRKHHGYGNSKFFFHVRTAPVNATRSTTWHCAECLETFLGAVRAPEASLSFQASKERWNDHGGSGQRRNYWLWKLPDHLPCGNLWQNPGDFLCGWRSCAQGQQGHWA